jgi:hypothetical protein
VRVEELSNHPAAQVRAIQASLDDERRRIDGHHQAVDDLRTRQRAARRWWQLGKRLRQHGELQSLKARAPYPDPYKPHQLAQHQAGLTTENQVTIELAAALADDWVLFRGYTNRRGEVDHLLVGPRGVWAIEVKGRGVRVNVDGDRWTFDKYDRYGNLIQSGALTDRRGRSWGRQVSDVAADLERFLGSRGVPVPVQPAVAVVHPRAQMGQCHNLLVVLSIGTGYLLHRIHSQPATLGENLQAKIVKLVRQDHVFHTARRNRGRSR